MSQEQTTAAGPIHLNFRSVQQVVVEPADEDRFMITAMEAARACQRAQNVKDLRDQFSQLLVYLREWCARHAQIVEAAYVYPGDGFLNVLVCTRGAGYRFDFDDTVTELDIELTQQFDWLAAEVLQVPERAREGNVSLEKAIIVYGDGSAAFATGGA